MDRAELTWVPSTSDGGSQAAVIGTISNKEKRYTTNKVEQCGLEWEIPQQDLEGLTGINKRTETNRNEPRIWVPSPRFEAGKLIGRAADWCIQLTNVVDGNGVGFLSLYLRLLRFHNEVGETECGESNVIEKPPQFIDIIYRLELLKNKKQIVSKESAIRRFRACVEDSIWGWMRFIPISELFTQMELNKVTIRLNMTLLQKDVEYCLDSYMDCTLEAKVNLSAQSSSSVLSIVPEVEQQSAAADKTSPVNNSQALSEHLENENVIKLKSMIASLWNTKQGCDAEIKSGEKVFKVHANILSARSDFFCRLFSNPIQQKTFIADEFVNEKFMEVILEHCYTGNINLEKNLENYLELYKAAFKLEMRFLRDEIFVELSSPLWLVSTEVAMIILRLGVEYPPTTSALKNLSKYFIHHLNDMEQLEEYTKFRETEWSNAEKLLTKLIFDV